MLSNSHEYMIKQKAEGKFLVARIFLIAFYVVFITTPIMLTFLYSPVKYYPFFILCTLAAGALLIFLTWRFTCIEYEVVLLSGEITLTTIYGKGFAKATLNMSISNFIEIGEYNDQAYEAIRKMSIQKDIVCMSSLSAPLVYYAIYEDDGTRIIVYFDVTEEAIEILKRENRAAFRAGEKRIKDNQQGGQAE